MLTANWSILSISCIFMPCQLVRHVMQFRVRHLQCPLHFLCTWTELYSANWLSKSLSEKVKSFTLSVVLFVCQVFLGNCARVYRRTEEAVAAVYDRVGPSANWRLVKAQADHFPQRPRLKQVESMFVNCMRQDSPELFCLYSRMVNMQNSCCLPQSILVHWLFSVRFSVDKLGIGQLLVFI